MIIGSVNTTGAGGVNIRKLSRDSHWQWLKDGWSDLKRSRTPSFEIGGLVVAISLIIIAALYFSGYGAMIPVFAVAFAFAAPVLAALVYAISRGLEHKDRIDDLKQVSFKPKSTSQIAFIGFFLGFMVLVWLRIATLLYAFAYGSTEIMGQNDFIGFAINTPQGVMMALVGTIIAVILAVIGFMVSAISIPLVFDRDIDAFSAMAASARAVTYNKTLMFSWAFVISVTLVLSAFFAFVPLIVVFPWLGHVTWRAYKELVE
jgi:uncharacterized membrane protein